MISNPIREPLQTRLATAINKDSRLSGNNITPVGATNVPSQRQTTYGLQNLAEIEKKRPEYNKISIPFIRSKSSAPSTLITENALIAKALLSKVYFHNMAAIKKEYVSTPVSDSPDFSNLIDFLA